GEPGGGSVTVRGRAPRAMRSSLTRCTVLLDTAPRPLLRSSDARLFAVRTSNLPAVRASQVRARRIAPREEMSGRELASEAPAVHVAAGLPKRWNPAHTCQTRT